MNNKFKDIFAGLIAAATAWAVLLIYAINLNYDT